MKQKAHKESITRYAETLLACNSELMNIIDQRNREILALNQRIQQLTRSDAHAQLVWMMSILQLLPIDKRHQFSQRMLNFSKIIADAELSKQKYEELARQGNDSQAKLQRESKSWQEERLRLLREQARLRAQLEILKER